MGSRRSSPTLSLACLLLCGAPLAAQDVPAVSVDDTRPDDDVVVTATRSATAVDDLAHAASHLDADVLRSGPDARSLPNALAREPGVLLQKTGPGQSSPFLRGFTGFRTLWLIDGVRLNNSVWRDGPNQYAGTVDNWSVSGLDVIYGPGSVVWGSDAIGGTLNARTAPVPDETGWRGLWGGRYSTAERALVNRLEIEGGEQGEFGLRVGVTDKSYGNLHAGDGSGDLPGTAYDERDADLRLDVPVGQDATFTVVGQRVRQHNVPRVHRTVESVPWHGTTAGSELQRDLDQERDLLYASLDWVDSTPFWDEGRVVLSWQHQGEEQDRIRTGGPRRDVRGFDVDTVGLATEFVKDASHGVISWGLEASRDEVDSFRRDFVGGVPTGPQIQGPVADDARYDRLGVFVQDEIVSGDVETTLGVRWEHAAAKADRIDNPNVAGGNPNTPGNVLRLDESWSTFVGSARSRLVVDDQHSVWAGLSQGYRAPNLSDLTSDLEDSGIESPTPDLDPEHFVTLEVGGRAEGDGWHGELVVHHTWIDDMIVRSPTGAVVGGTPVFQKDNVGDGTAWGAELRGECALVDDGSGAPRWVAYGGAAWLSTDVEQFRADGSKTSRPFSRQMPLSGHVGVRRTSADERWTVEADVLAADEADELSLRDKTDTQRIPPGGTPGWGVFGVRGRHDLGAGSHVALGVENLFDKDYRIHGSGQNEPGRSLVLSWTVRG